MEEDIDGESRARHIEKGERKIDEGAPTRNKEIAEKKNDEDVKQNINVKQERSTEDEDLSMESDEEPRLSPAAFGLQRIGTPAPKSSPSQPVQVLNARGMPARIRKKNRLFFDDDIVNTPHHRIPSAKKLKTTPIKKYKAQSPYKMKGIKPNNKRYGIKTTPPSLPPTDRRVGQKIGMRLRNLLKLPKAHKWVCYEWFYSNIDRCLFSGDNDFIICLKESFPELKTRQLTRVEWTKIRRMMGRPRRCSQAFFDQERLDLEKKRNKIRALQQRKLTDYSTIQDLPSEVPMQLVIGTKVTARLRKPQDGLFTGSIDAVDTSNNTYRITFERCGLGTHSVPDYEVLSNESPDTISLNNAISKTLRRNNNFSYPLTSKSSGFRLKRDPIPSSPSINRTDKAETFPYRLLQKMVLVKKILSIKRVKIKLLKSMNSEIEKNDHFDDEIPEDFERRYAGILIDLEKLNADLESYLEEMQSYSLDLCHEPGIAAMLSPSHLREKCREEAYEIVLRNNAVISTDKTSNIGENILDLITDLTGLMLQVKALSDSEKSPFELQVLHGTMEQIKMKLSPGNQAIFESNVEVHMKHIENGLKSEPDRKKN